MDNVSEKANSKSTCIICKIILSSHNTKVDKNQKYVRYRSIVCNICFDQYYPQINSDQN